MDKVCSGELRVQASNMGKGTECFEATGEVSRVVPKGKGGLHASPEYGAFPPG